MPLAAGVRFGPYEILAPLGAGGMGEVYKARDTRLDRTVAIKVLPSHIAAREDLRARFEREARAVSSLNHPHICVLYDIGAKDGVDFMVMEHLEGETLQGLLKRGPLPLEQALKYAMQIADAVDRAHRSGVVHRDLKPGNIMLTRDGAKVLDFGLAKTAPKAPIGDDATITAAITSEGTVLGTPRYMSPEQIEGREADARSDIFAFGCVLYEMVTGKRAFDGKTKGSVIGAILAADPPAMSTLQPVTPRALERLVQSCLAKDPEERWQSMRDVLLELRSTVIAPVDEQPVKWLTSKARWRWVALVVLACVLAATSGWLLRPLPSRLTYRYSITAPEPAIMNPFGLGTGGFALSPDGTMLVFSAQTGGKSQLWLRRLDSLESKPLPETEDGYLPFWSPDGRSIGFFAQGSLLRAEVAGSPVRTICDAEMGRGGSWNARGVVLFTRRAPREIVRVPAAGGTPVPVIEQKAGDSVFFTDPSFLPDGNGFLYGVRSVAKPNSDAIFAARLDAPDDRRRILTGPSNAVYAPAPPGSPHNRPGYLLFNLGGSLMAQPFDPSRLELRGDPVAVAGQVRNIAGLALLSVSRTGTLAYEAGEGVMSLVWRERNGRQSETPVTLTELGSPSLSPDGKRLAYARLGNPGGWDIWVRDLARGADTRFTVGPGMDVFGIWSPSGDEIVYSSAGDGTFLELFRKAASGAGEPEQLTNEGTGARASDWSGDGQFLLFHAVVRRDLMAMQARGEKKVFPAVATPFTETHGRFSPGAAGPPKWFAYSSDVSGTSQIYVQAFIPGGPASGARVQVSTSGGTEPRWRGDGKELYYLSLDGKMMAVPVNSSGTAFEAGPPTALFETTARPYAPGGWSYDVTRDGQRFILLERNTMRADPVVVIVNWQEALPR